jgi:3-phosphoshikimate 1-carboxyvinyltransferase
MQPLLDALNNLGAHTFSTRKNGCLPVVIGGRIKGGFTQVEGITSQYLTSLLIATPLSENDTAISVQNHHEKPYVEMTMSWLDKQGILYRHKGLDYFEIMGDQSYKPFKERISGDFSSATFFLCAGAIADADITLVGLDMNDSQGDKKVVHMLETMGADIEVREKEIIVRRSELVGQELDLNDTPDALPALAVVGCCAQGKTVLKNVPQARIKETDRIAVMRQELSKMGARIEELPDGLIIHQSKLKGTEIHGHGDHRVVMGMAIAGLVAEGVTRISTAETIQVTFPNFVELMEQCGAKVVLSE